MSLAEHYEHEAAEARELTHLKNLLAHAVPLKEVEVIQADRDRYKTAYEAAAAALVKLAITTERYQRALARIARPTTGYQCDHILDAREALKAATDDDQGAALGALPFAAVPRNEGAD